MSTAVAEARSEARAGLAWGTGAGAPAGIGQVRSLDKGAQ
jgi:hypothetical protein